jgi:hypothetical protein
MRRPRVRIWMMMVAVVAAAIGCLVTKYALEYEPYCTMGRDWPKQEPFDPITRDSK